MNINETDNSNSFDESCDTQPVSGNNIQNEYQPGEPIFRAPYSQPVKKSSGKVIKTIAAVLACAIVGGASGVGGAAAYSALHKSENTVIYQQVAPAEIETPVAEDASSSSGAPSDSSLSPVTAVTGSAIYEKNLSSCVGITSNVTTTNIFGMTSTGVASGSGFIISRDGYIVTNYHVVEDGSGYIVTLADGTKYDAVLIGFDSSNDLAVMKVDAQDLKPVTFGSSDSLKVGDYVCTIGNPLGELTFSMTQGIISALDREISVSSGVTMNLLQTDCAINSGNSGGPLFDSTGNVVGITNAKYSSSSSGASIDNIGFAIPIDQVKRLITEIIETGTVAKPYLGISGATVSEAMANAYNMTVGVYVQSVNETSCAAIGGLQEGDTIVKFNGADVKTIDELNSQKNKYSPGDTVTLTVDRDGEIIDLTIILDKAPAETQVEQPAQQQTQPQQTYPNYGFGNGFGNFFGFGY